MTLTTKSTSFTTQFGCQSSSVSERLADRIGKTYRKGAGPQAYSVGELSLDDLNLICASLRSFHHAQTPAVIEARLADAYAALRSIAEGNLGDASWQANYETIKQVARNALSNTSTLGNSK